MSELKAGRELDALVAEKVMGWKKCGWLHRPKSEFCWHYPGPWDGQKEPPAYSTDIAAAWEVVERLAEDDLSVVIATNGAAPRQNGVKVFDSIHGLGREIFDANAHPGWYAIAETVPLAICRAALAACASAKT